MLVNSSDINMLDTDYNDMSLVKARPNNVLHSSSYSYYGLCGVCSVCVCCVCVCVCVVRVCVYFNSPI